MEHLAQARGGANKCDVSFLRVSIAYQGGVDGLGLHCRLVRSRCGLRRLQHIGGSERLDTMLLRLGFDVVSLRGLLITNASKSEGKTGLNRGDVRCSRYTRHTGFPLSSSRIRWRRAREGQWHGGGGREGK